MPEMFCYKNAQRLPGEATGHSALLEPRARGVVCAAVERCLRSQSLAEIGTEGVTALQ